MEDVEGLILRAQRGSCLPLSEAEGHTFSCEGSGLWKEGGLLMTAGEEGDLALQTAE